MTVNQKNMTKQICSFKLSVFPGHDCKNVDKAEFSNSFHLKKSARD